MTANFDDPRIECRRLALGHAVSVSPLANADAIVVIAAKFEAYLTGVPTKPLVITDELVDELVEEVARRLRVRAARLGGL